MRTSIRDYFESKIGAPPATLASNRPNRSAELAAAALLLEVIRSDASIDTVEQQAVLRLVRGHFRLDEDESESLLQLAAQEVSQAADYYQFASLINQHFDPSQKQQVIDMMWQAAYADGELVAGESQVLQRVAELLQIAPDDYVAAKVRASDAVADAWRTKE
jgi:uncharacterized tellurite resistance protein B-like protein